MHAKLFVQGQIFVIELQKIDCAKNWWQPIDYCYSSPITKHLPLIEKKNTHNEKDVTLLINKCRKSPLQANAQSVDFMSMPQAPTQNFFVDCRVREKFSPHTQVKRKTRRRKFKCLSYRLTRWYQIAWRRCLATGKHRRLGHHSYCCRRLLTHQEPTPRHYRYFRPRRQPPSVGEEKPLQPPDWNTSD